MTATLDDLDRRLVAALHLAPRASFDDLSSVLGVDATTIGRRFARLQEDRVLRVVGQVDWEMYSTTLPVHLLVHVCGTGGTESVLDGLLALPQMQYVARTTGDAPVFATLHAASEAATVEVLDRVHRIDGVGAVVTLPVLGVQGRGAAWAPDVLSADERELCLRLTGHRRPDGPSDGPVRLEPAERSVVELLQQDGRASAAALGRAAGLAPSTAHRVVRKVLDHGWVRPRVEIEPHLLDLATPFVLRLRTRPGGAPAVLAALDASAHSRYTTRVAGPADIVCTGVVGDREHLARLVDEDLASMPEVERVEADIVLVERRRYWMDRDPSPGLGRFAPPPLT